MVCGTIIVFIVWQVANSGTAITDFMDHLKPLEANSFGCPRRITCQTRSIVKHIFTWSKIPKSKPYQDVLSMTRRTNANHYGEGKSIYQICAEVNWAVAGYTALQSEGPLKASQIPKGEWLTTDKQHVCGWLGCRGLASSSCCLQVAF